MVFGKNYVKRLVQAVQIAVHLRDTLSNVGFDMRVLMLVAPVAVASKARPTSISISLPNRTC